MCKDHEARQLQVEVRVQFEDLFQGVILSSAMVKITMD